ncbi:unnamed protein product [Bursaphelenchus xylophilus]|uniref:Carboxylic ester hydrolase n=1 Tax=Bursaphelenchus xylophilus TaxID=6326 RepID=A0A1I7SAL9_BURXY|nr:unnamed protein product [Bursaphelenchus xylophilus]CAG9079207.1 unnamed protein product [Bursaphelenchus xylophilus]
MSAFLWLAIFLPAVCALRPSREVHTEQGTVQGFVETSNQKDVEIFLGIPYAEAPISKEDWFAPSKPALHWTGVRNTSEFAPSCWFPNARDLNNGQSLDCLYLNVFAPSWSSHSPPLPVLFYIHGGEYVSGTPEDFGDRAVAAILPARQDVIVVTMAYRFGILGFYTTGDDTAPGNQGLWDLAEALRWTYNNIEHFGGDPRRITVGGHSTGSMSAEILSLSPVSKDMVHQLILMSGTNDFQWEPMKSEETFENVKTFAHEYLNFTAKSNDTKTELSSFLQSQDPKDFEISYKYNGQERTLKMWASYDGKFIPDTIDKLRKQSLRPATLVGCTRFEAILLANVEGDNYYEEAKRTVIKQILRSQKYDDSKNQRDAEEILSQFLQYSAKDNDTQQYWRNYTELMSDVFFTTGIYKYVMEHVQVSERPIFVYRFDHYFSGHHNRRKIDGSTHADDIPFVLGDYVINGEKFSAQDNIVLQQFSSFVGNFVKFGNPNGSPQIYGGQEWTAVRRNTDKLDHFVYNYYENGMSDNWFDGRHKKWIQIREKYAKSAGVVKNSIFVLVLAWFVVHF